MEQGFDPDIRKQAEEFEKEAAAGGEAVERVLQGSEMDPASAANRLVDQALAFDPDVLRRPGLHAVEANEDARQRAARELLTSASRLSPDTVARRQSESSEAA